MKWDTLAKYYERTNIQDNIYFMITNKINNTKAKAAPDILLFPQPQLFISHSSFFIFTLLL